MCLLSKFRLVKLLFLLFLLRSLFLACDCLSRSILMACVNISLLFLLSIDGMRAKYISPYAKERQITCSLFRIGEARGVRYPFFLTKPRRVKLKMKISQQGKILKFETTSSDDRNQSVHIGLT